MGLRDALDRRWHGRREQRDLTRVRRGLEDGFDVLDETHLQHFVGFVEHQITDAGQIERAALEMVEHASRRADDDMYAAPQRRELRRGVHVVVRSEEQTSELQSLMRISYAVFCLEKKKQ